MESGPTIGRRECANGKTPEIYSTDASIDLTDNPYVSVNWGFWVGVGYSQGETCLYVGNENAPICVDACVDGTEFSQPVLATLAEEFADELLDYYDISFKDYIVPVAAAVLLVILLLFVPTVGEEVLVLPALGIA